MQEKLLNLDEIRIPVKHQRITTKDDDILRNSIATEGLKDPITVVKDNKSKKYILAEGTRRFNAVKYLLRGVPKIDRVIQAYVRYPDGMDAEALARLIRITANYHRQDFYPSQKAHYLKLLSKKFKVPLKEIAKACGVSLTTLDRWLAVSDCSQEIKMLIDNGVFPVTSIKLINTLKSEGQLRVVEKFRDRSKVSAKELEHFIRHIHRYSPDLVKKSLNTATKRPYKSRKRFSDFDSKLSLPEIEAKIREKDKEITFMRKEILRAKPLINAILKNGKLRLALPGNTLRDLELFKREDR